MKFPNITLPNINLFLYKLISDLSNPQTKTCVETTRSQWTDREVEGEDGRALKEGEINWGRQLSNYQCVRSEVKEINGQLMGEYGFANDKGIGNNVSIVLWSECNLASGVLDFLINLN